MCNTPVALVVFRRPDLTAKVLDVIRLARPAELYVISDAPREGVPGEAEACAKARALIETVDWDCEVRLNYADQNMGCGHRLSTGFDWLFEQVESAIILEDDCVPDPSFFRFCEEMLERYRDDDRVMHISGCTYKAEPWEIEDSYFFSQYPACWGWATWRRAWQRYDVRCGGWPELRETGFLREVLGDPVVASYWSNLFDQAHAAEPCYHTWDYQWAYTCWANSGLSVCPKRNLISNIGSGEDATHTDQDGLASMFLPVHEMPFPLRHPTNVLHNTDLDIQYVRELLLPHATPPSQDTGTGWRGTIKRMLPETVKHRIKGLVYKSDPRRVA